MNPEAFGTAIGHALRDLLQVYERALRVDGRWMRARRVEPLKPREKRPVWTVTEVSPDARIFTLQCGEEKMVLAGQELVDGFEPLEGP